MSTNLNSAPLVAAAVCLLTVNDAWAKRLVAILPFGQTMAMRGLVLVLTLVVASTLAGQRPRPVEMRWAVLRPLGGALAMALTYLVNRRIDPAIDTGSIVVATTGLVTVAGMVMALGGVRLLAPADAASLVGMGVAVAGGYACPIAGFRQGEISFSVPFRYVSIPFAMRLGWEVGGTCRRCGPLWVLRRSWRAASCSC